MTIERYDDINMAADLKRLGTQKAANAVVGGLSRPGKMPCRSYNLPASRCRLGAVLRHRRGSTCFGCYAGDDVAWQHQGGRMMTGPDGVLKGSRYATDMMRTSLAKRFESLTAPLWTPAMVLLIGARPERHFRWHDSGDLQSAQHLANIATVARWTPDVAHWLPTRELEMIRDFRRTDALPDNLAIRLSATMVDRPAPKSWPLTSTVVSHHAKQPGVHACPAPQQGNQCGDCRACWSKSVPTVAYSLH